MKKILISLFFVFLLSISVLVYANDEPVVQTYKQPESCTINQDINELKKYSEDCQTTPEDKAICCFIDKLLTIGDWFFAVLLVVAILIFLFSAWTFLTSAGTPDKIRKARDFLIYGVIGVAVAFLAELLVKVVATIVA